MLSLCPTRPCHQPNRFWTSSHCPMRFCLPPPTSSSCRCLSNPPPFSIHLSSSHPFCSSRPFSNHPSSSRSFRRPSSSRCSCHHPSSSRLSSTHPSSIRPSSSRWSSRHPGSTRPSSIHLDPPPSALHSICCRFPMSLPEGAQHLAVPSTDPGQRFASLHPSRSH